MIHPKEVFSTALTESLKGLYANLSVADAIQSVTYCDPAFGEFSSNIAFRLAKAESKSPQEIAESVLPVLKKQKTIAEASFVQPGFINVRLEKSIWQNYLSSINDSFASSRLGNNQKIQLEFISANPTGPLVLTNAWQGFYGDILANIYSSQGFKVSREYFLNDGGNQVDSLGKAIQQALGKEFDEKTAENLYRGEYINETAQAIVAENGSEKQVLSENSSVIGKKAADFILEEYIKPDLARLGVNYDSIFSETRLDIEKTLARLESSGLIKKKDGAIWLDGAKTELNQDEVLIRSYDNQPTYFLKDIAYQLERLEERGFDLTITIVGPDHHGQAIRLLNTLKVLGHGGFEEISTQTIRLIKDGKEFKMSKRKGNYILLDDFLDMVPTEAARFYFAMRDTNTHMDFDIDLIKEHSAKNPVYYSLYAYARACSIEANAKKQSMSAIDEFKNYEFSQTEQRLVVEISKVPLILQEIIASRKVHQLLHQTFEVAKAFHEYYESERVLTSLNATQKLKIIRQFKTAYEAIFAILGISLLEQM